MSPREAARARPHHRERGVCASRRRTRTRNDRSAGTRHTSPAPARGVAGPAAPVYRVLPGLRVALRPRVYFVDRDGETPPTGPIRCIASRGSEWGLQMAVQLPDVGLLRRLLTRRVELEMLIPVPPRTSGPSGPSTIAGPEVYARAEVVWAEAFEHPAAPCHLGIRFIELDPDAEDLLLPFLSAVAIPLPRSV